MNDKQNADILRLQSAVLQLIVIIPLMLYRSLALWLVWGWLGVPTVPLPFHAAVGVLLLMGFMLFDARRGTEENGWLLLLRQFFGTTLALFMCWVGHLCGAGF